MPPQELFEYFKSTNSYTSSRNRSSPGHSRRRRKARVERRSRRTKAKKVRGLDGLKPVSVSGSGSLSSWLPGLALLLVAAGLLFGSYLLGRSHGVSLSTEAASGPASPREAIELDPAERTPPTTEPLYSVLVRALDDTRENETLALDIQVQLDGLGYPHAEAVVNREHDEIRVYVGRSHDPKDPGLRSWLGKVREIFEDARIIER